MDNINSEFYGEKLEKFLAHINEQIYKSTRSHINFEDITAVDRYLYEVNNFYYQSFYNTFFPEFKKVINEDVTRLINLGIKEEVIKKDILANLKRYAQLYNRTKYTTAQIKINRNKMQAQLLVLVRKKEQLTADLLYVTLGLLPLIENTSQCLQSLENLLKDQELTGAAASHPFLIILLQRLVRLNHEDPLILQEINRLLSYLHGIEKQVSLLQQEWHNQNHYPAIIDEITEKTGLFFERKPPAEVGLIYDKFIYSLINDRLQLLEHFITLDRPDKVIDAIRRLQQTLNHLMLIINRSRMFNFQNQNELLDNLDLIKNLNFTGIDETINELKFVAESLSQITSELSAAREPNFDYYYSRISASLDKIIPAIENYLKSEQLVLIPLVSYRVKQLRLESSHALNTLILLNDRTLFYNELSSAISTEIKKFDDYADYLLNTGSDLERMLAPRNIARIWKDHNIKVQRLNLEEKQPFPTDYLYLLDKYSLVMEAGDYQPHQIIHAEGDIFLIQVDDLTDEEIPYIIVGQPMEE